MFPFATLSRINNSFFQYHHFFFQVLAASLFSRLRKKLSNIIGHQCLSIFAISLSILSFTIGTILFQMVAMGAIVYSQLPEISILTSQFSMACCCSCCGCTHYFHWPFTLISLTQKHARDLIKNFRNFICENSVLID